MNIRNLFRSQAQDVTQPRNFSIRTWFKRCAAQYQHWEQQAARKRGYVPASEVEELAKQVAELKRQRDEANVAAKTDTLTKLPNHRGWNAAAKQAYELSQLRNGSAILFFIVDLDNFKQINDTFGHPAGDRVLRDITQKLSAIIRKEDCIARAGGDEFYGFAPINTLSDQIERVINQKAAADLEKMRAAVANMNIPGVGKVTVSIGGVVIYPGDEAWVKVLADKDGVLPHQAIMKLADMALYGAKAKGRNAATLLDRSIWPIRFARSDNISGQLQLPLSL